MSFQHTFQACESSSSTIATAPVRNSLFDFDEVESEHTSTPHSIPGTQNSLSLHSRKKKLIEMVKRLSKDEYIEIFKIFTDDQIPYSENSNGVFIYLNHVGEETIYKVFQYIDYISIKKSTLLKDEEVFQQHADMVGPSTKIVVNNFENTKTVCKDYEFQENHDREIHRTIDTFLRIDNEEEVDNAKISLKRKKNKYSGNMAKLMNSFKESRETNVKGNTSKSYNDD
jgi:hypothetical protein